MSEVRIKAILTAGAIAGALAIAGTGHAQAHNLLLVAGTSQISIVKLTNGNVVVRKSLADCDADRVEFIEPAAGGQK